jgi:hypothetical protein
MGRLVAPSAVPTVGVDPEPITNGKVRSCQLVDGTDQPADRSSAKLPLRPTSNMTMGGDGGFSGGVAGIGRIGGAGSGGSTGGRRGGIGGVSGGMGDGGSKQIFQPGR